MIIECPSCHLTANVNKLEIPSEGRLLNCPRCKNSFRVTRPPEPTGSRPMGSCPACHYSTFTDEVFAVCPKCGMTADKFEEISRQKREREQPRDLQGRNCRNPDLIKAPNQQPAPEAATAAQPVRITAWLSMAVGVPILCYGITGLARYYEKDWQKILSEPRIEPVSKLEVFFTLGFMPWLLTLFSIYFIGSAARFLMLCNEGDKRMAESAMAGVAVVIIYELLDFINWIRISTAPSIGYYATGILSSLLMVAILGAPFFALLWYINGDAIRGEFR